MEKEKLEVESSEEDEKVIPEKEEPKLEEEGTKVAEEEKEKTEDEFEKKEEFVSTNKFNQAVRKQRELELEKRELEKQLAEKEVSTVSEKVKPTPEKKEEDKSFFEDIEEDEEKKEEEILPIDASKLIDEKLKPVLDTLKRREDEDRKKNRTAFFEAHPEYQHDAEKWNGLLDVLDKDINPNTSDDYISQLNKAHILFTGQTSEDIEVSSKKKEMASDAASGSGEAVKATAKEEFTAEDRKYMKEFGISEDGMRAYKEKIKSGSMRILS